MKKLIILLIAVSLFLCSCGSKKLTSQDLKNKVMEKIPDITKCDVTTSSKDGTVEMLTFTDGRSKDNNKTSAVIYLFNNNDTRDKAYTVINETFKDMHYKYQYDKAIVVISVLMDPDDMQEYKKVLDEIFNEDGKMIGYE